MFAFGDLDFFKSRQKVTWNFFNFEPYPRKKSSDYLEPANKYWEKLSYHSPQTVP